MGAYFVLQIEWKSEKAKQEYVERLSNMIERNGGNFIIASSKFRIVEGEWKPGLLIVIRFPTMQQLSGWYDSPEYGSIRQYRVDNSRSDGVIVEGD
jgi:uncharacterized protein (DUF1330 family)